jgi:protein-disulfide isomerase-like protein with CxxC motif
VAIERREDGRLDAMCSRCFTSSPIVDTVEELVELAGRFVSAARSGASAARVRRELRRGDRRLAAS